MCGCSGRGRVGVWKADVRRGGRFAVLFRSSAEQVKKILSEEYNPVIDDDGDVRMVIDGMKYYLKLDGNRNYITMIWAFDGDGLGLSRAEKLDLCNKFYDGKIIVRFRVTDGDDFYADYFLPFEGGLNALNLTDAFQRFVSVVTAFRKELKGSGGDDESELIRRLSEDPELLRMLERMRELGAEAGAEER